jgi:hypothetical protein
VNKKRYDTVTFLVGNQEFYALVRAVLVAESIPSQCEPLNCLVVTSLLPHYSTVVVSSSIR